MPASQDCWTKSQLFILHRAPTLRHCCPACAPEGSRGAILHGMMAVRFSSYNHVGGWGSVAPLRHTELVAKLAHRPWKESRNQKILILVPHLTGQRRATVQLRILTSSGDILPRPRFPSQWEEPFVRCEQLDEMMTCTINLPRPPVPVSTYRTTTRQQKTYRPIQPPSTINTSPET